MNTYICLTAIYADLYKSNWIQNLRKYYRNVLLYHISRSNLEKKVQRLPKTLVVWTKSRDQEVSILQMFLYVWWDCRKRVIYVATDLGVSEFFISFSRLITLTILSVYDFTFPGTKLVFSTPINLKSKVKEHHMLGESSGNLSSIEDRWVCKYQKHQNAFHYCILSSFRLVLHYVRHCNCVPLDLGWTLSWKQFCWALRGEVLKLD